jgi:hypothetical protein
LLASVPEKPCDAVPEFSAGIRALREVFAGTDWRRSGYGRVICQGGNLRLVVTPCGEFYLLQSAPREIIERHGVTADLVWRNEVRSANKDDILYYLEWAVGGCYAAEYLPCEELIAFCEGLPEFAADGEWPEMCERP